MKGETDAWTLVVIAGLAGISVLTRCFFFILEKPWSLPGWAQRSLHYAPVAALAGVVLPEVLMSNGHLAWTWQDARIYAAVAGAAIYIRFHSLLYTVLGGMAVYLPVHLVLGW